MDREMDREHHFLKGRVLGAEAAWSRGLLLGLGLDSVGARDRWGGGFPEVAGFQKLQTRTFLDASCTQLQESGRQGTGTLEKLLQPSWFRGHGPFQPVASRDVT